MEHITVWMLVSSRNSYVQMRTSTVLLLVDRTFGWWWGHEGGALMKENIAFISRDVRACFLTLCSLLFEDTTRSWLSAAYDGPSPQPHPADTLISSFWPPEPWEKNFGSLQATQSMAFCYSHLKWLKQRIIWFTQSPLISKSTSSKKRPSQKYPQNCLAKYQGTMPS